MNSKLKSYLARTLLLICLVGQSGCLWVAAGATAGIAGYAYWRGNVSHAYQADLESCWQASHQALQQLGMPIVVHSKDALTGYIESYTSQGDKVQIHLEVQQPAIPTDLPVTNIGIRIATFGDQATSQRIHQEITTALNGTVQLPPIQVPPNPIPANPVPPPQDGANSQWQPVPLEQHSPQNP